MQKEMFAFWNVLESLQHAIILFHTIFILGIYFNRVTISKHSMMNFEGMMFLSVRKVVMCQLQLGKHQLVLSQVFGVKNRFCAIMAL